MGRQRGRGKGYPTRSRVNKIKCFYCQKMGHFQHDCYKKHKQMEKYQGGNTRQSNRGRQRQYNYRNTYQGNKNLQQTRNWQRPQARKYQSNADNGKCNFQILVKKEQPPDANRKFQPRNRNSNYPKRNTRQKFNNMEQTEDTEQEQNKQSDEEAEGTA